MKTCTSTEEQDLDIRDRHKKPLDVGLDVDVDVDVAVDMVVF